MTDILDYSIRERSVAGARMVFRDFNTGEPVTVDEKEMYLMLMGPGSNEFRRVRASLTARAKEAKPDAEMTDEEMEEERVEDSAALARLVTGGELYSKGEWLEMSAENVGDFFYKVDTLRAQAVAFVMKAGNFLAVAEQAGPPEKAAPTGKRASRATVPKKKAA